MLDTLCIMIDADNCWLYVVTWAFYYVTTIENLTSLALNILNTYFKLLLSMLSVEGTEESIRVKWVTTLNCFVSGDHSFYEFIMNTLVNYDTSQSGATLTSCTYCSKDTSLEG